MICKRSWRSALTAIAAGAALMVAGMAPLHAQVGGMAQSAVGELTGAATDGCEQCFVFGD